MTTKKTFLIKRPKSIYIYEILYGVALKGEVLIAPTLSIKEANRIIDALKKEVCGLNVALINNDMMKNERVA